MLKNYIIYHYCPYCTIFWIHKMAYTYQRDVTFNRGWTLKWQGFVLFHNLLCGTHGPVSNWVLNVLVHVHVCVHTVLWCTCTSILYINQFFLLCTVMLICRVSLGKKNGVFNETVKTKWSLIVKKSLRCTFEHLSGFSIAFSDNFVVKKPENKH